MGRLKRPSDKFILACYQKKACNMTATAEALGISRRQLYKWYNGSEKLKAEMDNIKETLLDFAESKLAELIAQGDKTAIIFFLKCQGKKRGYVERQETEISVNPFQELMKSLPDE